MSDLRDLLIARIGELADVTVALWKDTALLCVFHKDREIAHFQNEREIDIRLTPAIIRQRGLQPPVNTTSHPDRAKRSRWIVQSFATEGDLDEILALIHSATKL